MGLFKKKETTIIQTQSTNQLLVDYTSLQKAYNDKIRECQDLTKQVRNLKADCQFLGQIIENIKKCMEGII